MSGGQKPGGYTIVETMIFLAVTGVLFLIASLAINGKQQQADFITGVQDFNTQIQTVINDVSTGYFPQNNNVICSYNGSSNTIQFQTGSSGSQGTHDDCIFLGKVLFFSNVDPQAEKFSAITVAGSRTNPQDQPVSTLAEAQPVPVDGITAGSSSFSLNEDHQIINGLRVSNIIQYDGSAVTSPSPAAFAVFTSLPQSGNSASTGAQSTEILSIPGSDITQHPNYDSFTNGKIINMASSSVVANPTIAICLEQGIGGKKAAIIIDNQNGQATTSLHIGDVNSTATGVPAVTGGATC